MSGLVVRGDYRLAMFCVLTVDGFLHMFDEPFFAEGDDKEFGVAERFERIRARTHTPRLSSNIVNGMSWN